MVKYQTLHDNWWLFYPVRQKMVKSRSEICKFLILYTYMYVYVYIQSGLINLDTLVPTENVRVKEFSGQMKSKIFQSIIVPKHLSTGYRETDNPMRITLVDAF